MADLRAIRGANTEEQLEALQAAFLDARDAPAASMRRVGRHDAAPSDAASPAATRATTSMTTATDEVMCEAIEDDDDDTGAASARTPAVHEVMRDVFGDIVEREPRAGAGQDADAAREAAARAAHSANTGFPEVKHRSETNFGKSRFAARKAAAREAAAGKAEGGVEGSSTSTSASASASASAARGSFAVDVDKEASSIEEENSRILKVMSVKAVKEAQEEFSGRLNAKTLEFLRNRGASKSRAASTENTDKRQTTSTPSMPVAPKRARERSDVAAEASARTKKITTVGVEHIRFGLDGVPLVDASIDVATSAQIQGTPAPLPTERDPLRAGEGAEIGYTFQEAGALTRSSVASQRVIGLTIIGRVLKLARRWSYAPVDPLPVILASSDDSPPRLPNTITWASVWVYATVDCAVITLLRRALDDAHAQPMNAALVAIQALVGGVGVGGVDGLEATLVDALESTTPIDSSGVSYAAPLWRAEPEDAPCGGSGFEPIAWEHAVEEVSLGDDSHVQLAEEPDEVEEGLNKQMSERRQATEQAADPIAALLRMGILQRLRYALEIERDARGEIFIYDALAAFARHSKAAVHALARCPRLVPTLVARVKDSCTDGARGSPTEPMVIGVARAVKVLRLIAQSNPDAAKDMSSEGVLKHVIQAAITFGGVSTNADGSQNARPKDSAALLWREAFKLWAATSASGVDAPAFDAIHPLIAPWMEKSSDVRRDQPLLAMDMFALLTTLSISLPEKGDADDAGPPAAMDIADSKETLSWRCATAAAKCAEEWLAAKERDVCTLHTMSSAARYLVALVAQSPNNATHIVARVLGLSGADAATGAMSHNGLIDHAFSALDDIVTARVGSTTFEQANLDLAAWGSLLHSLLLLMIVTPSVWSDGAVTALAARIIRQFDGKSLTTAESRSSADEGRRSISRRLSLGNRSDFSPRNSEGLLDATAIDEPMGDPTVWMGQQPLIAASRLPLQRAVIVAMEILDKAFTNASDSSSPLSPEAGTKRELQLDANATADATMYLMSSLPPGAGVIASQAMSSGLFSVRVLEPLLKLTKNALNEAAAISVDASEDDRARMAILETGVNLTAASVSLIAPPEVVRDALLGGFAMEFTTPDEARSIATPGPTVAVGSLLPAHKLWLLAPASPRTTIQGWGVAGVACALSLLMGMELAKVSRVRALPPAQKMAAIGAVYLQGANVWRDPAVSAPMGLLTDLYWRRMVRKNIQQHHASGGRGYSMDLTNTSAGVGGLNDPLNVATGAGDAAAAAALVNAFASDSFGDALFARHVAIWLRSRVSPKARAATWIALCEGIALHLLPCTNAMVPPAAAFVFFPSGGEPDPTMRELYIKTIEDGLLDKALSGWAGDEYPTPGRNEPPLSAALAIHALAHVILSPSAGEKKAVETLRRILRRPNTKVVLRALLHTPLTIKRRPSFAAASVGTHKTPFGNGFVYGKRGQDIDIPPRRTLLLDVCGDDEALIQEVENALIDAGLLVKTPMDLLTEKMNVEAHIQQQSSFYARTK